MSCPQSRFLSYEPSNATAYADQQWIVPYTCEQLYSKGGAPLSRFLTTDEETTYLQLKVANSLSYIICNPEQEGKPGHYGHYGHKTGVGRR